MMCFQKTNARKRFEALIQLPLQKFQVFFPHASKICPHRMSSSKASWSPTSSTITTGAKTFTTDLRRLTQPHRFDSVSFNFSTSPTAGMLTDHKHPIYHAKSTLAPAALATVFHGTRPIEWLTLCFLLLKNIFGLTKKTGRWTFALQFASTIEILAHPFSWYNKPSRLCCRSRCPLLTGECAHLFDENSWLTQA